MKVLIIYVLTAVLALGGACSSGNSDPLSADGGGSTLGGQNLANMAVTEDSSLTFYMFIVNMLYDDYFTGVNAITNYSGTDRTVNTVGIFSGNLLVTAIAGSPTSYDVPDVNIEYRNFSNSGRFFYAGTLEYNTSFQDTGDNIVISRLILNGTLQFAGDYAGTIEFQDMRVELEANGELVDLIEREKNPQYSLVVDGTVIVTSGGATIRYNPNEIDHPIGG